MLCVVIRHFRQKLLLCQNLLPLPVFPPLSSCLKHNPSETREFMRQYCSHIDFLAQIVCFSCCHPIQRSRLSILPCAYLRRYADFPQRKSRDGKLEQMGDNQMVVEAGFSFLCFHAICTNN